MEKVERIQTKDKIASILRNEILAGRIADGEELIQEIIAEKLGVSRMPVREAFQSLQLDGLLLRLPNRHVKVVGLNQKTIQENLHLVAIVEVEVILRLLEQAKPPITLVPMQEEAFHNFFSDHLENHYIAQTHKQLLKIYPQYIWHYLSPSPNYLDRQHNILAAIKSNDNVAISTAVCSYYQSLADWFTQSIK